MKSKRAVYVKHAHRRAVKYILLHLLPNFSHFSNDFATNATTTTTANTNTTICCIVYIGKVETIGLLEREKLEL